MTAGCITCNIVVLQVTQFSAISVIFTFFVMLAIKVFLQRGLQLCQQDDFTVKPQRQFLYVQL